jgi:hypothetical protein
MMFTLNIGLPGYWPSRTQIAASTEPTLNRLTGGRAAAWPLLCACCCVCCCVCVDIGILQAGEFVSAVELPAMASTTRAVVIGRRGVEPRSGTDPSPCGGQHRRQRLQLCDQSAAIRPMLPWWWCSECRVCSLVLPAESRCAFGASAAPLAAFRGGVATVADRIRYGFRRIGCRGRRPLPLTIVDLHVEQHVHQVFGSPAVQSGHGPDVEIAVGVCGDGDGEHGR